MPSRFLPLLFACSLALGLFLPVQASTVEETTSHAVAYQFDGEGHHDAPDDCEGAARDWSVPLGGTADGLLVAPDDVSDVYVVEVPPSMKGRRMQVDLAEAGDAGSLSLTAFAPGCAGNLLDAINWPTPEPSPPAPAAGEQQRSADVSGPWRCDSRGWLFTIDHLQAGAAPASIYLAWTDGSEKPLALQDQYGAVAVYATGENTGVLLKGAWANLPASWDGQFRFAVGPCDAVDGGAVYGEPPMAGMGFLSFTPVRAGPHVVQVAYRDPAGFLLAPAPAPASVDPEPFMPFDPEDLAHDPAGTLAGSLALRPSLALTGDGGPRASVPLPGSVTMPMSCHMCLGQVEDVTDHLSYFLSARAT